MNTPTNEIARIVAESDQNITFEHCDPPSRRRRDSPFMELAASDDCAGPREYRPANLKSELKTLPGSNPGRRAWTKHEKHNGQKRLLAP
eukprot:scaffold40076_cov18-Prasinocladus_malaysianus.AAC.1